MTQVNPILQAVNNSDLGLDQVVQIAVGEDAIRANEFAGKIKTNQAEAKVVQGNLVDTISATATNDIITQVSKDTAQLQTQNQTNAILTAAGGTQAQVTLMTRLNEQGNKVDSLLAEKEADMADEWTGLSIIDKVINDFRTIDTDIALTHATNRENHTVNQINNTSAAQEAFAQTNLRASKVMNEATIEANSRKIEQTASIQADKQRLVNLHNNAQALSTINNADAGVTDSLLKVWKLQGDVEVRAAQKEQREFARTVHEQRLVEYQNKIPLLQNQLETSNINLDVARRTTPSKVPAIIAQQEKITSDIANTKRVEEEYTTYAQDAYAIVGLPIPTEAAVAEGLRDTQDQNYWKAVARVGAEGQLGNSPAEAKATLQLVDRNNAAPDNKYTRLFDEVAKFQVTSNAQAGVKTPKEGTEEYNVQYNLATKSIMTEYAKEIKAGDASNPYSAPPFDTIRMNTAVANSALYQKVLADMGWTTTDPQLIVDAANAAVIAKTVTIEEAATGVAAVFKAAIGHNNADYGGFMRIGFDEYVQNSYNTEVRRPLTVYEETTAVLGTVYDLASPIGLLTGDTVKQLDKRRATTTKYENIDMSDEIAVRDHLVKLASSSIPTGAGEQLLNLKETDKDKK